MRGVLIMIKNCFVINSENIYWWFDTKEEAENYIEEIKEEQHDIRFTHSKCDINDLDKDDFSEIEVLEVFMP
jgi:hypothetical protein